MMTASQTVRVVTLLLLAAVRPPLQAQAPNQTQTAAGSWMEQTCGLKPGHYLVNSGVLHLKKGVESKFPDARAKSFADAGRVLLQALNAGQRENPAAWYYLGRYYTYLEDGAGADSAFTRAERLRPECANDIGRWRQMLWAPVFNAGVAAYQEGKVDSAIAAFRQASAMNQQDPRGPFYLGILEANSAATDTTRSSPDSAIKYFRIAIERAGNDTTYAKEKRQASFNLARMYHVKAIDARLSDSLRTQYGREGVQAYRDHLGTYPNDIEAMAGLASMYTALGQRDSATVLYRQVLARADSVGYLELFNAGVAIARGAPPAPDTAALTQRCRGASRATTAAVRRACQDSVARATNAYRTANRQTYELAAQAFAASLEKNPYYRDALYNLATAYHQLRDSVRILEAARRLVAVDPMNRSSNLLLAQAYQVNAKGDSALHYLQVADSILPVEINVSELVLREDSAVVGGLVTNFHNRASAPLTLAFEFLNPKGEVVETGTVEVPQLAGQASHPFRVEVQGSGISAYRYKKR